MKPRIRLSVVLFLPFLCAVFLGPVGQQEVHGGGPLSVTEFGTPYSWARRVKYTPDKGSLGRLNNSQAITLVAESFGVWQDGTGGRIQFTQEGQLSQDVTERNVLTIFNQLVQDCLSGGDCINAIVFDTNGRIIDALLGRGASDSVVGFAGPMVFSTAGRYLQGRAVLNGRFANNLTVLRSTMIHEFGHFIGLDHCQLNSPAAFDSIVSNDVFVPMMFPYVTLRPATLHVDDSASVGFLYPSSEFFNRGQITGRILLPDGTGFQGANVIARSVADPQLTSVTSVSGFLHSGTRHDEGFGTDDPEMLGFYQIVGLPEGRYTIEVEEIWPLFDGGSSVGPLDPPEPLPGPAEFYSGAQESANDYPDVETAIEVTTGSRISDINIILNANNKTSPGRP